MRILQVRRKTMIIPLLIFLFLIFLDLTKDLQKQNQNYYSKADDFPIVNQNVNQQA
jgi:uncharacterized membrane protein YczE